MRRLAIALLFGSMLSLAGWHHAGAQSGDATPTAGPAPVDVLQVSGLFDEIVVDTIEETIARTETNGSQALILQLNTKGAVVSDARMAELFERVANAKVAVAVWVGPSRSARAYGTPAQLFAVADATAMVPGSRLGHTGRMLSVGGKPLSFGAAADTLASGSMSFKDARTAGILKLNTTDEGVPTVRSMVGAMDGLTAKGKTLATLTQEVGKDGAAQSNSTLVRFLQMGQIDELMHTVASPAMAYLLFVIGLCLLVFEFFTAGVGIAGVIGAVCTVLGCYGLAALPVRGWALGLLIAAILAFAVDTQVGIPRFWTAMGLIMFVPASWFLFRSLPGTSLRLPWLTLIVGVVGVMFTFIVGMPSMVRTRFATPTIGREWMIGHLGTAVVAIDPNGVAEVSRATWRARTNRATPIPAGATLRVVGIDGVTLDVEPQEGAARDYRERRAKHATPDSDSGDLAAADPAAASEAPGASGEVGAQPGSADS